MTDTVHSQVSHPADYRSIAYFSMEIGIEDAMPTYSGGLGVLAGDTIRAAADLKVPMVGMTLLHRKGYFYQRLYFNRQADGRAGRLGSGRFPNSKGHSEPPSPSKGSYRSVALVEI